MNFANKVKTFVLLLGDIVALYLGLFAMLLLRYGNNFYNQFINKHFLPFTIIFVLWIVIFYISGLYDLRRLRNNLDFLKILSLTLFVNATLAVFFFYLIPVFGITPKTNLFLFIGIFAILEIFWRRVFNRAASSGEAPNKVLLVGGGDVAKTVYELLLSNPQMGYEVKKQIAEDAAGVLPSTLHELVAENNVNLVVIPRHLKRNTKLTSVLYELLSQGVEIRDLTNFYELVVRKVPLADLEEAWFLENLINQRRFYDQLKRAFEFSAALLLTAILSPLLLLIAVLIKLTSAGPVLIRQKRVGRMDVIFTFLKFRTMVALTPDGQAETKGAQWSTPNDNRVTAVGKFLRYTHLDELPQLINIIKGQLSFVGPRPERPEFVKILEEKIPYYDIRHLVKPGVTGWAQINYRYGASVEDSFEKLEYDIYYIKNRSIILDFAIILKTIRSLFVNQK